MVDWIDHDGIGVSAPKTARMPEGALQAGALGGISLSRFYSTLPSRKLIIKMIKTRVVIIV